MEIRHLELLRELRERGTLGAVAAATFRTPSALSQQLRTAERELGVALVEPVSRGLRLTWAGEILADGADDVLASLARVEAALDAGRGEPSGVVRIGTLPSAGAALLPSLMARLVGTRLSIVLEDFDLAEADYAGRTLDHDLVIAHSLSADVPTGAEGLFSRVVAREPIDVAVPADHPLAAHDVLAPVEVAGYRWIAVPRGYPFATVLESIERETGTAIERIVEIRDNRLVESLVSRGLGLALLPRFSTPPSPAYRLVPLTGVGAVRRIVAIGRQDRVERRAVSAVLDRLVEIGRTLS
ncbi:LysR family transcriptional regulator [Demequina mangrovi]|uniref:DNA-binding transcriptional regulator, LysR family n=1 Tax=Demequina mangrovi TaxID=1043493 RepID=A0A1H6UFG9_9MICO|nr:LysR family transcriptional regulator [Demequina mangrovi]SEI86875.1 DNA-binding transcriptional regulator, LysR family [Demequina mangrovi]